MNTARLMAAVLGLMASSFLCAASAECQPDKATEKYPRSAARVVKVASTTSTLPFAYSDPANLDRLTGIEVDMIDFALRQCAGLRYEFLKGPFSSLIQTVMSGSSDVMIGNVNYTRQRAETVDFIAYMRSGQTVIVQHGNPGRLNGLDDLCGRTASSTVGGVSNAEVERQSAACVARGRPGITYIPAVDQEAAVRALANKRIDFVMDGSISAKQRVASHPHDASIGFTIVTDLIIGPVVRKDNEELRRAVLEGLQVLERSGRLKDLLAKYDLTDFAQPVELRR